jgi:hypothetical protein
MNEIIMTAFNDELEKISSYKKTQNFPRGRVTSPGRRGTKAPSGLSGGRKVDNDLTLYPFKQRVKITRSRRKAFTDLLKKMRP